MCCAGIPNNIVNIIQFLQCRYFELSALMKSNEGYLYLFTMNVLPSNSILIKVYYVICAVCYSFDLFEYPFLIHLVWYGRGCGCMEKGHLHYLYGTSSRVGNILERKKTYEPLQSHRTKSCNGGIKIESYLDNITCWIRSTCGWALVFVPWKSLQLYCIVLCTDLELNVIHVIV